MSSKAMVDRVTTGFVLNYSGHPVLPGQKLEIEKLMYWTSSDVINVTIGNVPEDNTFTATVL
ncbi:hypothetical protein [Chlorobium sp.]|uniref:hypothetical protein n=2 Tax=Chlorobium sp. TaxID=1095 RepID=UPI0025B8FCF9|nr:hypothetical protein [Chlorobium sp.]MCF8215992.1 hypothetical protein [Chlorobium sp.]MCF8270501.1 hypothetical protein [Chlorobium sp.]MCF8290469.1 hypothetical protein [Chlorobium sp.]MCF8384703.1 hypothetical protein [Chlorobium sp.]